MAKAMSQRFQVFVDCWLLEKPSVKPLLSLLQPWTPGFSWLYVEAWGCPKFRLLRQSTPEPLLASDTSLCEDDLQQVHANVLSTVWIWDGELDVAFNHVLMFSTRDRSLPAKRAETLDQLVAGYGR